MTDSGPVSASAPAVVTASTRSAAVVCAAIALVVAALEIVAGAYFWMATANNTSEDPLVGLGYVIAIAVGAPGVLGAVLGGLGWWLASRQAGLLLAVVGVVVAVGPGLLLAGNLPGF